MDLTYPRRKLTIMTGPFLKITLSLNCPFNKLMVLVAVWHVASSCLNHQMLMFNSCIYGNKNVLSMCRYRRTFTTVFVERERKRPPPLPRVDPHTTKRGVSVCPHFLASISCWRLLS